MSNIKFESSKDGISYKVMTGGNTWIVEGGCIWYAVVGDRAVLDKTVSVSLKEALTNHQADLHRQWLATAQQGKLKELLSFFE